MELFFIKFARYLEWFELKHRLSNSPGVGVGVCLPKGMPKYYKPLFSSATAGIDFHDGYGFSQLF